MIILITLSDSSKRKKIMPNEQYEKHVFFLIYGIIKCSLYPIYPSEYLILRHPLRQKPDRVKFSHFSSFESREPINENSDSGDWFWNNITMTVSYIVKNTRSSPRDYMNFNVNMYKCFFPDCIVPKLPSNMTVVEAEKPADIHLWSSKATWKLISEPGYGGFLGGNQYDLPKDGDNVKIPSGFYIMVDTQLPKIKTLEIEGYFEFSKNMSHRLEVQNIIIRGGQFIIGEEDSPFLNDVEIKLTEFIKPTRRRRYLETFSFPLDSCQIQVFGGLNIHGKPQNVSWTKLNKSARAGDSIIELIESVDWQVGDSILISTTQNKGEDEEMIIKEIASDKRTLTLENGFSFDHVAGGKIMNFLIVLFS